MKTRTSMIQSGFSALLILGGITLVPGSAFAQRPTQPPQPPQSHRERRPLNQKQILDRVEKSLPGYDARFLRVQNGPDWMAKVDFLRIFQAVGDEPIQRETPPEGAKKYVDADHSLRLDVDKGDLSYVNRARGWNFERHASTKAFDRMRSSALVLGAVQSLDLPKEEIGELKIRTQVGGGGRVGAQRMERQFEMYRLAILDRKINGLPVIGSKLLAAVSNEGQIQRLHAAWPQFRLVDRLRLRERNEVVEQAVNEILDQEPGADTEIRATLGYAPQTGEKGVTYVPAVVLSVLSLPTPYQVVVPVAEADLGDD